MFALRLATRYHFAKRLFANSVPIPAASVPKVEAKIEAKVETKLDDVLTPENSYRASVFFKYNDALIFFSLSESLLNGFSLTEAKSLSRARSENLFLIWQGARTLI